MTAAQREEERSAAGLEGLCNSVTTIHRASPCGRAVLGGIDKRVDCGNTGIIGRADSPGGAIEQP